MWVGVTSTPLNWKYCRTADKYAKAVFGIKQPEQQRGMSLRIRSCTLQGQGLLRSLKQHTVIRIYPCTRIVVVDTIPLQKATWWWSVRINCIDGSHNINKACTTIFMRDAVRDGQTLQIRSLYLTVWPASRHDVKNAIMHASSQASQGRFSQRICAMGPHIRYDMQSSVFQPYNKNALFHDGLNYRGTFWRHEFVHETMMRSHELALLQPMLVTWGLQCPSQWRITHRICATGPHIRYYTH